MNVHSKSLNVCVCERERERARERESERERARERERERERESEREREDVRCKMCFDVLIPCQTAATAIKPNPSRAHSLIEYIL